MAPENRRKSIVFYATFIELGDLIYHEAAWITVAAARTRILPRILSLWRAVTTAPPLPKSMLTNSPPYPTAC